jgi:predicted nucleotidyltransferase
MKSLEDRDQLSISNDMAVLREIRNTVITSYPEAVFYFFGSRARGEGTRQSDLDLLILLEEEITTSVEERIGRLIYDVELSHEVVVNSIILSKYQWNSPLYLHMPFRQAVEREGIAL